MTRFAIACLLAAAAHGALGTVATPVITEPATENQVVSPFDVHMVAGPFEGGPGEGHVCTDWEIRTVYSDRAVWTAPCVTGALAVHVHLGDGQFVDLLEGQHQLASSSEYRVRVRFLGDAPPSGSSWSEWAERRFVTTPATAIQGLVVSDVSAIPAPRWRDEQGAGLVLPAGTRAPTLRLIGAGAEVLLELAGSDGTENAVENPPHLEAHGAVRVLCDSGSVGLALPASRLAFTDGSGEDREIYLPAISLAPGESAAWWIAEGGGAFADATGGDPAAPPDFSAPQTEPPVPWAIKQPGFRIERVASDLELPVNIAFVPNPGAAPEDPFYYVTELYGVIKVVSRSGQVSDYATGLLNFDPFGSFPGAGEKGLTGIVVEPESGDLFASMVYAAEGVTDYHFPRVLRLHSTDGGKTASSQTTVLEFPDEPLGPSHQISSLSIGPDGRLYVHIGDGLLTTPALDLHSVRGKILRVDLDGSAPPDNPFFDAADDNPQADLIYVLGLRNPFGGCWRAADGSLWEVENGPSVDRLAKVVAGRNYLWNGTDASMTSYAAYLWSISHAPVNIAFVQESTFGGSLFPPEKMDHAFVTESGATYAPGPQERGKRISEFVFDLDGNLVGGPVPLVEYLGAGRATAAALAAGPDGLYFTDLYKDFGAASPVERGASVFRISWTGVADFRAELPASPAAPVSVRFEDASNVPDPTAWHWEFGDGAVSEERDPVHVYKLPGTYDVRLTVSGSGGPAVRQKPAVVTVDPATRAISSESPRPRPTPRILGVRSGLSPFPFPSCHRPTRSGWPDA